MVAQNTRYHLVSAADEQQRCSNPAASAQDLLPWADPYIALLVQNLQAEVRRERVARARLKKIHQQPSNSSQYNDAGDKPHWPLLDE